MTPNAPRKELSMSDRLTFRLGLLCAALAVVLCETTSVRAQCASCGEGGGGCATCGNGPSCGCCPKPFVWWSERPPKIKFKCACPRPVCNPCELEHYGYYQTCWCSWPYPPDLRHCPCAANHPAMPFLVDQAPPMPPAEPDAGAAPRMKPELRPLPMPQTAAPVQLPPIAMSR